MEFNREKIVKALECCTQPTCVGSECPLYGDQGACVTGLNIAALSLIKELTAKIEAQDIIIPELLRLLENERKIKESTADVIEIVRCKDCIYSYLNTSNLRYTCHREYPRRSVQEDDYCSYGKRREE